MHVIFKKLEDGRWRLSRGDNEEAYRVSSRFLKIIQDQLKENYNIETVAETIIKSPEQYRIIAAFDNEADEAEFIMRATGGILINLSTPIH